MPVKTVVVADRTAAPAKPQYFKTLLPAFVCVFVDYFGYATSIPILPYFALDLGASAFEIGVMTGVYPLAQLIGNVIMGRLSDTYGRKPVILASLVCSSVTYALCGIVQTSAALIAARALAGICGATMPVAQAMVLDTVTDMKLVPKYSGICGSMLGVAFTVGPGIGAGVTAASNFRVTFFVTSGICALCTAWAWMRVVETKPAMPASATHRGNKVHDIGSLSASAGAGPRAPAAPAQPLGQPRWGALVWGPCFVLFCTAWSFFVMCSIGSLAWLRIWGWGSTELGIVLVFAGLIQIVSEGVLAKRFVARFGAVATSAGSALVIAATTVVTFMVHVVVPHLLLEAAMCFAWGLQRPPLIAIIGRYCPPWSRGAAMGALIGCMSLGFATGPFVSGATFEAGVLRSAKGFSYLPFVLGGAAAVAGAVTMLVVVRPEMGRRDAERERAGAAAAPGATAAPGRSSRIPSLAS